MGTLMALGGIKILIALFDYISKLFSAVDDGITRAGKSCQEFCAALKAKDTRSS